MTAAPAVAERWTRLATRVLAPNAGPMTLDGTNSFLIRDPGQERVVVVDPGPEDEGHLDRLRAEGTVELILLTHRHGDHVEAAPAFARETGAPVRAFDPALCIGAPPLVDGEEIRAGGTRVVVVATPGHTSDSVSLHLPDDVAPDGRAGGTMLSGDTILGRGTTIIAYPDGSLGAYLRTLDVLARYGAIPVLPAHGPLLADLAAVCGQLRSHRTSRLEQVQGILVELGRPASEDDDLVALLVDRVYPDVDPAIRFAAEASTRAQLSHLVDLATGTAGTGDTLRHGTGG